MHDEFGHPRNTLYLSQLLAHYARLAEPDRQLWHDRLMALEGVEPQEITKLHGDLLALGWLEWTSSHTGGKPSACYRLTPEGLRAHRLLRDRIAPAENVPAFETDNSTPTVVRRKRPTKAAPELISTAQDI
jgi:hypothetical protein